MQLRQLAKKMQRLFWSSDRKRREFAAAVANFSSEYSDVLIIMADPETDVIFMSHKGFAVPIQMKKQNGDRMHIVRNALAYSKFEKSVDQLLLAVDSGLAAIAKSLHNRKRIANGLKPLEKARWEMPEPPQPSSAEAVPSPIQVDDIDL